MPATAASPRAPRLARAPCASRNLPPSQPPDEQTLARRRAIITRELAAPPASKTPEIKVSGNHLVIADPTTPPREIQLQGLCIDSMEWGPGEHMHWALLQAIDEWKANCIRLPVQHRLWFGLPAKGGAPATDAAACATPAAKKAATTYRRTVDELVRLAAARGAWLVLDLHAFGPVNQEHLVFWKDAASRYKNHPAVLYELFNEPVGVSWKIWRDGGSLAGPDNRHDDNNPVAIPVKTESDTALGMQDLVNAVRSTGARNLIIAGGIDWGYDLTGILSGHALADTSDANGIMYSSHVYPWLNDWQKHFLDAAAKHPLFIGEVGCPPDYERFPFIPQHQRYPLGSWAEDMIAIIQQKRLNWTGFSFHPRCGPMAVSDWDYTPTPYWGAHVKAALSGKQYQLKNLR
ncbi:glycoside hydrolase family 5 protein [Geminisphaera colitermitum]|uniref:glycoside hydrolase family 5 protein n=1 Tax=Geminisphaera colitermitum TaxID=1148786 RepID=UPI000695011E|nr:cellulase family glycosylhydrolase [Geminisphaera colitermitum]